VDIVADGEAVWIAPSASPMMRPWWISCYRSATGLSLIEELRRQKVKTPVIVLSAKRSVDDRIKGLQAGGDDYLTKPFSFSELLAESKR